MLQDGAENDAEYAALKRVKDNAEKIAPTEWDMMILNSVRIQGGKTMLLLSTVIKLYPNLLTFFPNSVILKVK